MIFSNFEIKNNALQNLQIPVDPLNSIWEILNQRHLKFEFFRNWVYILSIWFVTAA